MGPLSAYRCKKKFNVCCTHNLRFRRQGWPTGPPGLSHTLINCGIIFIVGVSCIHMFPQILTYAMHCEHILCSNLNFQKTKTIKTVSNLCIVYCCCRTTNAKAVGSLFLPWLYFLGLTYGKRSSNDLNLCHLPPPSLLIVPIQQTTFLHYSGLFQAFLKTDIYYYTHQ